MRFLLAKVKLYERTNQPYNDEKKQAFEGFDFLRAFFSLAIVAYKTKVFYIPETLVVGSLSYALSAYILSGMLGALAVPVFLQVSLFLFYGKSQEVGLRYFIQKRLPRLLLLYLFWVGSITAFDIVFVDGLEGLKRTTSSPKFFLEFIVSGNSTPYFFFFSLIFVTIVAECLILLFRKIGKSSVKQRISYSLLFVSLLFLVACSTIGSIITYTGIQPPVFKILSSIASWDYTPLNFLPYVFTAAIVSQEYNQGKLDRLTSQLKLKLVGLLFLTLLFFALEWIFTSNKLLIQVDQAPLDHYLRVSLVFGSWLLLYLALMTKWSVPKVVKFISRCSLGLYGFHVFFTFKRPLNFDSLPLLGGFFQVFPVLETITVFLTVLAGSIALTLIFKKVKYLRDFV
ncbi:MAG: acyltransferase family protein [Stenomitos frigidus ULC029]